MATTLIQCNHLAEGFTDNGQLQSVSQYLEQQKQQKAHLPTLMLYIGTVRSILLNIMLCGIHFMGQTI